MHLPTQQARGCISRNSLLGAAPPGPPVLGKLWVGREPRPWSDTVGSAPSLQMSGRKMLVLEALCKWRASHQPWADLRRDV